MSTEGETPCAAGVVLRVAGSQAAVDRFLRATKWNPLVVYWKGMPLVQGFRKLSSVNGFNVSISYGGMLSKQIRDAERFLKRHVGEFRRLRRLGLLSSIDLGVDVPDSNYASFFRFPRPLLTVLTQYALELEVSCHRFVR